MVREGMATKERSIKFILPNIDPSMLEDPVVDGRVEQSYVGRGSVGIVLLLVYCGIQVDVQQFLPHSLVHDMTKQILPLSSLPSVSGVCVKEKPFRLVMQLMVQRQRHSHKKYVIVDTILQKKHGYCFVLSS